MVVHAFPAAKLAALLIKQISKPIANAVKQGAKSSPVFRRYVCLPPAQFYNWCEVKSKMWLLQLGQPVNITVLNEAASIELGANLLGETVIFLIASGILLFEYNRSSKKETAKEDARKNEIQEIKDALRDLFIQTEEQGAHIRELTRKVGELDTRFSFKSEIAKETLSSHKPPPSPPPPPPPSPEGSLRGPLQNSYLITALDKDHEKLAHVGLLENCKDVTLNGVIFKAISDVESNFLLDQHRKREPGIIVRALNQLYKDVYRSHVTFCSGEM